ncbi:YslB family protein [Convivina intestini]|uniref:Uncharacterized protein DUF2507 n=1 Tax=Convivina intestini TaxID=1505726 RepID=A0A2U1D949_9LACO|nr:YslB family protein [Convivina intestini]PVY84203.1 uncharacterized protein DUF2507 [Convivina intestini]CAH1854171.1 hypothetical protein R077811_00841 [Convivina intestini]SDB90626.1 Protein of unknown function [Leuconostocaceae bacterium R-53105]
MNINTYDEMNSHPQSVNFFATLLLRDALLSNLLQTDYHGIAYWAGKELARQFPLDTIEELKQFFQTAGLGDLDISRQSSTEQIWLLKGPLVRQRLDLNRQADFNLETGFLAQQLENQVGAIAEGSYVIKNHSRRVVINILTDLDHPLNVDNPSEEVARRDTFLKKANDQAQQQAEADLPSESTSFTSPIQQTQPVDQNFLNNSTSPTFQSQAASSSHTASTSMPHSEVATESITNSLLAFQFDNEADFQSNSTH